MGIDAYMFVRVRHPIDAAEVKAISVRAQVALGDSFLHVARPGRPWGSPHHALEIVGHGPGELDRALGYVANDLLAIALANPTNTIVRVHTMMRYYGEGYERGDPASILTAAEWLHRAFGAGGPMPCEIWYGGDSGVGVHPFDADAIEALWDHFTSNQARAYFNGTGEPGPVCGFCDIATIRNGGGWYCASCSGHWIDGPKGPIETDSDYRAIPNLGLDVNGG